MSNLTSGLRFERAMWISRWPDFSKWMDQIFCYWLTLQWFLSESILEASISFRCYGNWKPIDARKYGYDVSVRPSTHSTAEALWVGVLRFWNRREGWVQYMSSLRLSWCKLTSSLTGSQWSCSSKNLEVPSVRFATKNLNNTFSV